jgi:hypothetical protein
MPIDFRPESSSRANHGNHAGRTSSEAVALDRHHPRPPMATIYGLRLGLRERGEALNS